MVSFPKERINIYKCRNFRDLVIYTGTGSGRIAADPAGSACTNSVTHFCCSPGEQDGLGQPEEEVWAVQGGCWAGAAHMEAEFSSNVKT